MIYMIEDEMPHATITLRDDLRYKAIESAYEHLSTCYQGINDFIGIVDCISDGVYSLSEVTIAGVILTDGLDGFYMQNNKYQKAKYLRVNGLDIIYLIYQKEILTNQDFCSSAFDGNNGTRYKLKKKPQKRKTQKTT